ncbi:MAG TPA: hypothetical protein VM097_11970, partial [Mycobacteriales bacterium]|nr:hypothetical protein [Mycobacteriales bacterium]
MTVPARHAVVDECAQGARAVFVPRPALERAVATALQDGRGAQLVGEAGMGKTRLAERVLDDTSSLAVSCSEVRNPTARDLLAVLLMQLDPPPSDLVHLLRGGSAGAGSTADEALLLKASGHRIA